ncbi:MAG: DMT family transporter, partial [Longicatena sp.]
MHNKNKIKLAIAMLIFGSIGIFVKNIDLASAIIVQWRTYIGFVFLTILFILSKQKLNINSIRKNIGILILTGIVLGTSWVVLFEAYRYTSVSMATLLYYCAPIIVFFLSACLFKERITRSGVIGILVAISGMIIINVVGVSNESVIGIICGLLSAVLYALLMILNKYIKHLSGLESTFIQLGVAAIVMSIYV